MSASLRHDFLLRSIIVVVLLAPVVLGGMYVTQKNRWARQQLSQLEPRYARLLGLRERADELKSLRAQSGKSFGQYVYAPSQDVSRAGNDAQQRVRDVFSAAGLDVMSIQVLPAKSEKNFDRIGIAVRLEGDLLGVQAALAAIPALTPIVLIDGMSLQTIGAFKPDRPQRLAVQLTLAVLRADAS